MKITVEEFNTYFPEFNPDTGRFPTTSEMLQMQIDRMYTSYQGKFGIYNRYVQLYITAHYAWVRYQNITYGDVNVQNPISSMQMGEQSADFGGNNYKESIPDLSLKASSYGNEALVYISKYNYSISFPYIVK